MFVIWIEVINLQPDIWRHVLWTPKQKVASHLSRNTALSVKIDYEYLFLPLPTFAHTVYETEWGISYDICKLYLEKNKRILKILISVISLHFNFIHDLLKIILVAYDVFQQQSLGFL